MEKILLFISTERQNGTIKKELEKTVEYIREENAKQRTCHLVKLASSFVTGNEDSITSAHDGQTLTLWHDLTNDDPLVNLPSNIQEEAMRSCIASNKEHVFRYNDFFLLAEALHEFADELQDIGSYLLYIFWCVDGYAPNPSEVPEYFGALKRLCQWHFGGIYIICEDFDIVNEWTDFLPLQVTDHSSQVVKGAISTLWRGHLTFSVEGNGEAVRLPECVIQCSSGQPALGTDSNQDALFILPTAEVVADFDVGTLPWIYLRNGGVYDLTPADHSDPEDREEVIAMLNALTAQPGMATLIRLRYSHMPPVLDGVQSLTTDEWKRIHVEGQFELSPKLHFRGYHMILNMIILSEGASQGKAKMVALQDPNSCGDDVVRLYTSAKLNTQERPFSEDERLRELLKDTPSLSSVHIAVLSHLACNLPNEIKRRLNRAGQLEKEFDDGTKKCVEAAASEELLRCLLLAPAPPHTLSDKTCTILPEIAVSCNTWPEYVALVEAEAEIRKQNQRRPGDLLGGLAPPLPSDAILSIEASQLIKLFAKNGQPAERVRRKMAKHVPANHHFFKAKSTLEEVQLLKWPEALYSHHHGIYYNADERDEKFAEECNNIKSRCIIQETSSTCSSFQDKESAFVTVSSHKTNSKDVVDPGKSVHVMDPLKTLRKHSSLCSEDTMSMKSGQSSKCNKAPLRRSPRKHYQQRQNTLERSPKKQISNDSRSKRSTLASKSFMKPSDLLQPTSRPHLRNADLRSKSVPKPADLSDIHKQKLRVAVVESLEREGIKMKDPLFKVCFKKLFTVCRPFALDVIGQGSTSKTMEKIAKSHVKQVIEFEKHKTRRR